MRIFKAAIALALSSSVLLACAASPQASEGTGESSQAVTADSKNPGGGVGAYCGTDASCQSPLVCELICPQIPGRAHCEIAGGSCEEACTRFPTSLSGSKFISTDGLHSITFTSATDFSKTDSCTSTAIHCEHVVIETGTYSSNGTTVSLSPTDGAKSKLSVEPHCYDGLLDESDGIELYPSQVN